MIDFSKTRDDMAFIVTRTPGGVEITPIHESLILERWQASLTRVLNRKKPIWM